MIVRLSVSDNDFGNVLVGYMKDYFNNLLLDLEPDNRLSEEEQGKQAVLWMKANKRLKEVIKRADNQGLTDDDKAWLTERTKTAFAKYISSKSEDTQSYLNQKLDVSFPDYFEDKWENGESCYWFRNSNVSLLQ